MAKIEKYHSLGAGTGRSEQQHGACVHRAVVVVAAQGQK